MPGFVLDMQGPRLFFKLLRGALMLPTVVCPESMKTYHPAREARIIIQAEAGYVSTRTIVRGVVPFLFRPARWSLTHP